MTSGAANTQYGLTADKTVKDIDDNNNQFIVPTFKFDEAGHFLMAEDHTITLPDGFSKITINGNSGNTFPAGTTGSVEADTMTDELTFAEGNKWITLNHNADSDTITISHAAAGTASTAKGDTVNQTPDFGATFKVLSAGIDEAGHVKDFADHTVTIPAPSLTNGTGNVVTSLSLNASKGAFTESRANLGTITLGTYTAPNNKTANNGATVAAANITNTTSLQDAIKALDEKIMTETVDRTNAIDSLDGEITGAGFVSSISQTNGKITATLKTLDAGDIPTITTEKISDIDTHTYGDNTQTVGEIAEVANAAYNENTEFDYTEEIKTLQDIISDLKRRIEALEELIPLTE